MSATDIPSPAAGTAGRLPGFISGMLAAVGLTGLVVILLQTFNIHLFSLFPLLATRYYYVLIGLFLTAAFLAGPGRLHRTATMWLDLALAAMALICGGFLAWNAEAIITEGWAVVAPLPASIVSGALVLLSLEAVRRFGGPLLLVSFVTAQDIGWLYKEGGLSFATYMFAVVEQRSTMALFTARADGRSATPAPQDL